MIYIIQIQHYLRKITIRISIEIDNYNDDDLQITPHKLPIEILLLIILVEESIWNTNKSVVKVIPINIELSDHKSR